MQSTRKITEDIVWVGSSDRRLERFENLFPIPRGIAYNAYFIEDEKTVLMDTVDESVARQLYENVDYLLDGRQLDYLVVNHVEPDHCAGITEFLSRFPDMKVVGTAKAIQIIGQFYEADMTERAVAVKEGEELSLGKHTLRFYMAPMVHWPEVMMTYDVTDKTLFSADAFGAFGAFSGSIFNDEIQFERDWLDDARRYYANIVGKYGVQVQNVLKKVALLEVEKICPLHGPIWRSNLDWFIEKYQAWSSYRPEEKGVVLIYGSVYGNTERAVDALAVRLADAGVANLAVYDVSSTHVSELISEIFRCSHVVLASATYNAGMFPPMENLLTDMKALAVKNRKVVLIENGSWALSAGKSMAKELEEMKEMTVLGEMLSLKSVLPRQREEELDQVVDQIVKSLAE